MIDGSCDSAEAAPSGKPRVRGGHPAFDELLDRFIEVACDLGIEVAIHLVAANEREHA
jgi:hypothetical protein